MDAEPSSSKAQNLHMNAISLDKEEEEDVSSH